MDCVLASRKRNHRRTGDARCRSLAAKPESQLPDRIDALRGAEWVNAEGLHKTKVQQPSLLWPTENQQLTITMKITLGGAAGGEVTGSCYIVETKQARILIDCGQFQGGKKTEGLEKPPTVWKCTLHTALITPPPFGHNHPPSILSSTSYTRP